MRESIVWPSYSVILPLGICIDNQVYLSLIYCNYQYNAIVMSNILQFTRTRIILLSLLYLHQLPLFRCSCSCRPMTASQLTNYASHCHPKIQLKSTLDFQAGRILTPQTHTILHWTISRDFLYYCSCTITHPTYNIAGRTTYRTPLPPVFVLFCA
jgi:hypothetical protein